MTERAAGPRATPALVAVVVAGGLLTTSLAAVLIARERTSLLALLPVAVLGLWALAQPRSAVTLFYVSVFMPSGYLQRYFTDVPTAALWLPHVLLLVAVVSSLFSSRRQSPQALLPPGLVRVGLLWLAVALVSLIANRSSPIAGLLSLRGLLLIYGSVLLHRLHFSSADQENLVRTMVWIGLAMLPITLVQRIVVVEHLGLGSGDMVTGLFASYAGLVFFQLFCTLAVTSWWLHGTRLLPLPPTLAVALLFGPLVVSNSKAAPIYFALATGFLLWVCRERVSSRAVAALLTLAAIGVTGTVAFDEIWQLGYGRSESLRETLYNLDDSRAYLFGIQADASSRLTKSGTLKRGAAVVFNYELIQRSPLTHLVGLGPGAVSHSRLPGGTGHVYARYRDLGLDGNSLSTIVGEIGLLGVFVIAAMLLAFFNARARHESGALVALRKSTLFLLAVLLIYGSMLLVPVVGLVFAILAVHPTLEMHQHSGCASTQQVGP